MELTEKQVRFVRCYAIDRNGKKAAIAAGYAPGSAAIEAVRLLKLPKIIAALAGEVDAQVRPSKAAGQAKVEAPLAAVDRPEEPQSPPDQARLGRGLEPLAYMLEVMNDPEADEARRDAMARAAAPYVHGKIGEGGKKDAKQDAAKRAATGRFGAPAPPKLTLVR